MEAEAAVRAERKGAARTGGGRMASEAMGGEVMAWAMPVVGGLGGAAGMEVVLAVAGKVGPEASRAGMLAKGARREVTQAGTTAAVVTAVAGTAVVRGQVGRLGGATEACAVAVPEVVVKREAGMEKVKTGVGTGAGKRAKEAAW